MCDKFCVGWFIIDLTGHELRVHHANNQRAMLFETYTLGLCLLFSEQNKGLRNIGEHHPITANYVKLK